MMIGMRGSPLRGWVKLIGKMLSVLALIFVITIVLALVLNNTVSRLDCRRSWRDSGMRYRYDWWAGCMVEPRSGKWIPAKSYREVP